MNKSTQNLNRVRTNILADLQIEASALPLIVIPCGPLRTCDIQFYEGFFIYKIDPERKVNVNFSNLHDGRMCEIYNCVRENGKFYSVSITRRGNKFFIKSIESFKY
jgi:hypothetical protein